MADEKKVKIKTVRAVRPLSMATKENPEGTIVPEGKVIEVTEEEAKMFCRSVDGARAYIGERYGEDSRHKIVRAQRVA